jgi:hypothetical protein
MAAVRSSSGSLSLRGVDEVLSGHPLHGVALVDQLLYRGQETTRDAVHGLRYDSIDTHFLSFSYKSLTIVASLMQFLFWLSDAGPAVGSDGNLYVPTGNSTFDAATGGRDYGDSVLKLDGSTLAIKDYFTPHDQDRISPGRIAICCGWYFDVSNRAVPAIRGLNKS